MSFREICAQLWISIITMPIIWVITVVFSNTITGAISAFSPDWYVQYWYLAAIALVLGCGIQAWALLFMTDAKRVMFWSLVIFVVLAGIYASKQILGPAMPLDLWIVFFVFCIAASQLAVICAYASVAAALRTFAKCH
jgi:hypothetical protein